MPLPELKLLLAPLPELELRLGLPEKLELWVPPPLLELCEEPLELKL